MAYLRNTDRNTRSFTAGHTLARGRMSNDLRVNFTSASAGTASALDDYGGAKPVDSRVVFPAFTDPSTAA